MACVGFPAIGQIITTVTNNADAGTGSLRWAIQRCNTNGAGLTDTIKFDLNNPANRIIILDTELPDISSNIIIDGTSQPGAKLSTQTDAKIIIRGVSYPEVKRGLIIINATRIAIYGLAIVNFVPADPINDFATYADGIYMQNVSHIQIGAPQKGNIISGNYFGIRIDSIPSGRPGNPIAPASYIRIFNNHIGPRAGIATGGTGFTQSGNLRGIYFNSANNVVIGGNTAGTGSNTFEAILTGVQIITKLASADSSSQTRIEYNTFNPSSNFNPALNAIPKTAINIAADPLSNNGYSKVDIIGNTVFQYNNGIALANLKNHFSIIQNELTCAVAPAPPLPFIGQGILLSNCDSGIVGGTFLEQNFIEKFPQGGVANVADKFITISKNIIKCTGSGITHAAARSTVPVIQLDSLYPTVVTGSGCAGCKIEVFRNNECLSQIYNGKTYDTTLVCDAGGRFRYDGPMDCNTSFTNTNTDGTTSRFYVPYNFIFDSTGLRVTPSTCERPGRIYGIKILKDVEWEWQNENGVPIGNDTDLVAMGGKYKLVAKLIHLGCSWQTRLITIPEYHFDIDSNILEVLNPYQCKPNAGKITGLKVVGSPTGPLRYQWKNQLGTVVGTSLNLTNIGAGTYILRITSQIDATCFKEAGPYVLTLQPSPVMNFSMATLKQDTCGTSEGGISGITVINPAPSGIFLWVNNAGTIIGVDSNLTGVPAGRYRLKYKDASPCDTLYSPWYVLTDNGKIDIDISLAIIKPTGCGRNTGSITNVSATNATNYYWVNVNTGDTVSTTINAQNLGAGVYRLLATNAFGCSRVSYNIQVDSTLFIDLKVVTVSKRPASCDSANAFIRITRFSTDPSFHQLKWLSATGAVLSTSASLDNIDEGTYRLVATDSNGCSKIIYTDTIAQRHKAIINLLELYKEADTCSLNTGRFSNIRIIGGEFPFTYRITDSPGRLISTNAGATGLAAGTYNLQVMDIWGCPSPVYPVIISPVDVGLPAPFYKQFYVMRGSDTAISLAMPYTNGGIYQLLDANKNPISQNNSGRFILLNIQNDFNGFVRLTRGSCTAPDAVVKIIVADTLRLKIPNAFSPNGDGINDVFTIRYRGVPLQMEVDIFDRYGQLVYKSSDFDKPWNGNSSKGNQPLPTGTYYWIVKGKDILGITVLQQGSITLLR